MPLKNFLNRRSTIAGLTVVFFFVFIGVAYVAFFAPYEIKSGALSVAEKEICSQGRASFPVTLSSTQVDTMSGSQLSFTGTIENKSSVAVSDVVLYAQVYRIPLFIEEEGDRENEVSEDLPVLIDHFRATKDFDLKKGGKEDFSFEWMVPAYLTGGRYRVLVYPVSNKQFLLAQSSRPDVMDGAASVDVAVLDEGQQAVLFTSNGLLMNGFPYDSTGSTPQITRSSPLTITAKLLNTSSVSRSVDVSWSVYKNVLFSDEKRIIERNGGSIFVEKASSKDAVLILDAVDGDGIFYVVGRAEDRGVSSYVIARFRVEGGSLGYLSTVVWDSREGIIACLDPESDENVGLLVSAEHNFFGRRTVSQNKEENAIPFRFTDGSRTIRLRMPVMRHGSQETLFLDVVRAHDKETIERTVVKDK